MGLVYYAVDTAVATRSTALYTNKQRWNLTFSFDNVVNGILCLLNMWIHRFLLNINPQHVRTKAVVSTILLVPRIYSSMYNRMYMLLEGQSSFMDASARHAVFSRLPKGYVYHCDKRERTHTVFPFVKEARIRCLVTLPH